MRGAPSSPAILLLGATLAGCCMDATIKHLAHTNHILLVAFGRYLFGALISAGIWLRAGAPSISAEMWRAHALRGFVITGTAVGFFWALTILPLAEAVTLSFIYPLLIPFVARIMLGEQVRTASVVAAAIGFVGVIVAAQGAPSVEESPQHALGVAAVIFSALMFALAMVLLRSRAQTDGPLIVGMMSSLFPALILAGPTLAFATPPRLEDWPIFLLMGAFAATFMYLIARAYAGAEAQKLAPIHYAELIWASAIGYLIFRETPRIELYLGAALIVAACLLAAYQERRASLKPRGV
ncbi:MAG: DMT family transporter [Hyphomonadaceae bacterium]|nr:DMT family transporter [Hyphomonadaceae bacterium]